MICKPEFSQILFQKAKQVRAVVTDVDGVMTNGEIVYTDEGAQLKFFNAQDGFAVKMAKKAGLLTGIISANKSTAIVHRGKYLQFDAVFTGKYEKNEVFKQLKKDLNVENYEICFIGDDVPDIPILEKVGLPIAVKNATAPVKLLTPFHTQVEGGKGALREVIDFILFAQNKYQTTIDDILESYGR